jgi:hypothetical protein
MAVQETVTIETPIGKNKVVLRGYVTGRIRQELSAIVAGKAEFAQKTEQSDDLEAVDLIRLTGDQLTELKNKGIELLVLSVDGQEDNIVDRVLNMHEDDTDFVLTEVNKIKNPLPPVTVNESSTATLEG